MNRIASKPERVTVRGELLLSHNHIALLHGLYDRPAGRTRSRAEWIRAASPYLRRFSSRHADWLLRKSMETINPAWVVQARRGRFIEARLTDRGRAILERRIASRIVGIGTYEGLPPGNILEAKRMMLPNDLLAKIADYTSAFGIPLLEAREVTENTLTVYALTTGIDKPFRIAGFPEAEHTGLRGWHYNWTLGKIGCGIIPGGYLAAYADEDPDDLLCYLKELLDEPDEYIDTYCKVYGGRTFLSREMVNRWLSTPVDFNETDIEPDEVGPYLRAQSTAYRALLAHIEQISVQWTHPLSGKSLGAIRKTWDHAVSLPILTATTPAALSCLDSYLARIGAGIRIETRYNADDNGRGR